MYNNKNNSYIQLEQLLPPNSSKCHKHISDIMISNII